MPDDLAIQARAVTRVYKAKPEPVTALDGVDLDVRPGEYFGLLGPNGAGKTTLIKILTTLLLPTSGEARIAGFDVVNETAKIRRVINMVSGGEQSGYGLLTAREQLWMFSQFYGLPNRDGWRRVDELIEITGLTEQRDQKVRTLSTGQRQKLNFARGLLNDPWVLFLDEPTLGLDPDVSVRLRRYIASLRRERGMTIVLTTHYMREAEELCDEIAFIKGGKILARGSADELKRQTLLGDVVALRLEGGVTPSLDRVPGVLRVAQRDEWTEYTVDAAEKRLPELLRVLQSEGVTVRDVEVREPDLEQVFVELAR
jgi:ABC-2 type transport system ATP-binding protein